MKKSMIIHAAVFLALCISTGMLMHVSQGVRKAEKNLARLDMSIERERETLRVLSAEWSMLNSPERIEALAKRYLDMDLPDAARLVSDPKKIETMQLESGGVLIPASVPATSVETSSGSAYPALVPRKPAHTSAIPQGNEGEAR